MNEWKREREEEKGKGPCTILPASEERGKEGIRRKEGRKERGKGLVYHKEEEQPQQHWPKQQIRERTQKEREIKGKINKDGDVEREGWERRRAMEERQREKKIFTLVNRINQSCVCVLRGGRQGRDERTLKNNKEKDMEKEQKKQASRWYIYIYALPVILLFSTCIRVDRAAKSTKQENEQPSNPILRRP